MATTTMQALSEKGEVTKRMIIAQTEQEIIDYAESSGSLDCAIKALRQEKKVLLCNPTDDRTIVLLEAMR